MKIQFFLERKKYLHNKTSNKISTNICKSEKTNVTHFQKLRVDSIFEFFFKWTFWSPFPPKKKSRPVKLKAKIFSPNFPTLKSTVKLKKNLRWVILKNLAPPLPKKRNFAQFFGEEILLWVLQYVFLGDIVLGGKRGTKCWLKKSLKKETSFSFLKKKFCFEFCNTFFGWKICEGKIFARALQYYLWWEIGREKFWLIFIYFLRWENLGEEI